MKVFVELTPGLSKAMERVVAALKEYAPRSMKFVQQESEADLVILHVIGFPETKEAIEYIVRRNQRYAIIQYCMRSTQKPNTNDWEFLWRSARLVWSYYDLKAMAKQDGADFPFHFYCSPLGADRVFAATEPIDTKMYTMMTSGFVAESEGVAEVGAAVKRIGGRHFHLGPKNAAPNADVWGLGISDNALADVYSRCCWVAGLRRCEGFEMPAAEGLVCGARPIMFDAPHYRRWFGDFADFIPEGSFDEVVESIVGVFESGCRRVSDDERFEAIKRFSWKPIANEFWRRVL
jgi:hypothetical protein